MDKKNKLTPIHPGEVLLEDFMVPLLLSMHKLALELRVPPTRITEIVHGQRAVTSETALRLAYYFKTTPQFWMNLQTNYDLQMAESRELEKIKRQVHPIAVAAGGDVGGVAGGSRAADGRRGAGVALAARTHVAIE